MSAIPYTISTRCDKAQDALVNRVLDFEMELMTKVAGTALKLMKSELKAGKGIDKISVNEYKKILSREYDISVTHSYCVAQRVLAMLRSRMTNTQNQYLPKAESGLDKAYKRLAGLKRLLNKRKVALEAYSKTLKPHRSQLIRLQKQVDECRMKIDACHSCVQRLKSRIQAYKYQLKTGDFPICLGSKALFKKQHNLTENGYASSGAWLTDYRFARWSGFAYVGDSSETGGGRLAKLVTEADGSVSLNLVLTNIARKEFDIRHLQVANISFGREKDRQVMSRILSHHRERASKAEAFKAYKKSNASLIASTKAQKTELTLLLKQCKSDFKEAKKAKDNKRQDKLSQQIDDLSQKLTELPPVSANEFCAGTGCAITVRLNRDKRGWRFSITSMLDNGVDEKEDDRYIAAMGCIGVDTNYDHFATCRVGENGRYIDSETLSICHPVTGKPHDDQIWIQARHIVNQAAKHCLPIVLERLDFSAKKRNLECVKGTKSAGYNRMLSTFAYEKMTGAIKRLASEQGVKVLPPVNPAYTSFIGMVNYANLTPSVHETAAYVIALRGQKDPAADPQIKVKDFSLPLFHKGKEVNSFTPEQTLRHLPVDKRRRKPIKIGELYQCFNRWKRQQVKQYYSDAEKWRSSLHISTRKRSLSAQEYDILHDIPM